jgi:hypothetical protein
MPSKRHAKPERATCDTGKIAAAWGAVTVANIALSHTWKRHIKNRFLKRIWPAALLGFAGSHANAAAHNFSLPED